MRASCTVLAMLVLALSGCGGDDAGTAGPGPLTPISGGTTAGTMVALGSTGGAMVGAGATGGAVAGMAGAGGMGGGSTTPDCSAYEMLAPGTPRGTHDAVATILRGTVDTADMDVGACAFTACHNSTAKATLNLTAMPDITPALVNVPACEAQGMVRVKPGDPLNSWLWIKLVGPADASGNITHTATPQNCSGATPGTLGVLMPWGATSAETMLPPDRLFQICSWITDGALGP